jgi:hypothetical protein
MTTNIVDYMIDVPYRLQFSICSKEKKKLGSKHIFLIIPEFPGRKKKKEKVCGLKKVDHVVVSGVTVSLLTKLVTKGFNQIMKSLSK